MPTNVTPEYREAEARFRAARSHDEKIAALEEMLAVMPKHKGTDKLQADLRARLAKLRREPGKKGGAHVASHVVPREGAGQVALVGPPNSGKSSLVARLTHAEPRVADYPYTTREPVPGMMPYQDIAIQLVDLPAVSAEHIEPWVFDLIRPADLLWLVLAAETCLEDFEPVRQLLEAKRILLASTASPPGDQPPGGIRKRAMLVLTGLDRAGNRENVETFASLLAEPWSIVPVSAPHGTGLEDLRRKTFDALDIIRVYTKEPGKPADREKPFTLKRGATVAGLAATIHKDLALKLRFARLWGRTVFDGQPVKGDHVLDEGDVVEIHAA